MVTTGFCADMIRSPMLYPAELRARVTESSTSQYETPAETENCRDLVARPLCIDLFCGLGGWADGFLAEGFDVIGFDVERHDYGTGCYPGQLVLQDVLTLHGSQFKDAAVIVASPPCTEYSYMAMPWSRAKQIARALRGEGEFPEGYTGSRTVEQLNTLFNACFRIAKEAGVPLIVENVVGAQAWVGRAKWHYGSFYLWGDVLTLMPFEKAVKVAGLGAGWRPPGHPDHRRGVSFNGAAVKSAAVKTLGHVNQRDGHTHTRHLTNQRESDAVKQHGSGPVWFDTGITKHSSKSSSRKAASAMIAKIPFRLARHIARCFKPQVEDFARVSL